MDFQDKIISEGLTYDDVLLIPNYSEVLPREVAITSQFTRNITLNVPIISAAMDTVTEAAMAIAMAREGGIGVLHKNMTIEEQAKQIRKVKRAESGMIIDPVTLHLDAKVADAKRCMKENNIGGIPIVDDNGILKGIVTNRDLRFEQDNTRPIVEVMTAKNLVIANEGTSMKEAEKILQRSKIEKLPVVDKNYKLVGLITFRDIANLQEKSMSNKDSIGRLRVAAALGVTADVVERAEALVQAGVDAVIIDTAHGHTKGVVNALKAVKNKFADLDVVVGNIATAEAALYLAESGADAVKVGIGPGSICTTRVVAGAKESPGETIIFEGRKYKSYRGMGSVEAMNQGSKDRYFQDVEDDIKKLVPEGIVGRVAYKGELQESMHQFIGGLRAGMGYCGAKDIETLQAVSRFVRITASGIAESHPHNITITKEAPNYSR